MKYRWVIALLCFLMILLGLGFCSSGRSIFLAPMTQALGISRSAFSVSDSMRFLTSGMIIFFFSKLVDRFGTKKMICFGFVELIAAVLLYAVADNLFLFYLAGILFGGGFAFTTTTMVGIVIARWFEGDVGLLMGIILGANGLGSAVSTQLYTPIIESGPFGYRKAFLITAGVLAATLLLFLFFYREAACATPIGTRKVKGSTWEGIPFEQTRRMPTFYAALVCIFLMGAILQGVTGAAAAHIRDVGLSAQIAATVVSINSIGLIFSKILSGFISDKLGIRVSVILCLATSLGAILLLAMLDPSQVASPYLYAVLIALGLPMETIMIPLLARHLFGMKGYSRTISFFSVAGNIGYAVGIPVINISYDLLGDYRPFLLGAAALIPLVFVAYQWIITTSNTIKKEKEQ